LINRLWVHSTLWLLWIIRKIISIDRRAYLLLSVPAIQPLLVKIGLLRARAVYLKAHERCPAYGAFLQQEGFKDHGRWQLSKLPIMTKENYVKKYSIQERCYDGKLPAAGVVIDESSGSSGVPNNWVRSAEEREDVKRILQLNYQLIYRDSGCILLNCFALGPWATGMNVSMSLVDVGILKSIGPDQQKLENTLEVFGIDYRYLVFGYPPFIKSFVDSTRLSLAKYRMDLIVGGEGISEPLRDHLSQYFQSVISSYGASDLEINIGVETELTINLRRLCIKEPTLSQALFSREVPPMIFQYNPLDYIIETTPSGELVYTIGRQTSAAPKIRYNLHDLGGTISHRELSTKLASVDIDIEPLAAKQSRFPILFVYGRSDLTVPFYGAKVYPTDIEEIINSDPELVKKINSFQIASYEDSEMNHHLKIRLESVKSCDDSIAPTEELRNTFFDGLCRLNQDFREVTRMFDRSCLEIEIYQFETGPFSRRDIRIKNKYVSSS
jgi:phenylacetate-CoA ligase